MRILCLGNNTKDTDARVQVLSVENGSINRGLLTELNRKIDPSEFELPGYYHSSIYDIEFGRLIELGNRFNRVIMLDQPVKQWSHPDAFYNTIRVMKKLSCQIEFLDTTFVSEIDYFVDVVEHNKSFCAFPFIEILVDRGNTTVCCRSTKPITPIDQLKDYYNDPHYQLIREKMLAGDRVVDHCRSCYTLEDLGIRSARQQETVEWANRLGFKSIEDFQSVKKPFYYEVRASNKCNLQCRMCAPDNSHLLDREYRAIGLIERHRPLARKFGGGFDIVNFENLKKLYVAGGEPLVMQETYEFLDRCVQQGCTDFELLINTNGTKLSERFKKLLKEFSNLQFIFSIDAYRELNHYIRWPSDWDTIINNWQYLRDHNHKVTVNTTVSIYNIHRLHDLYRFIDHKFPGTLTHCQIVESPKHLSPWLFPDSAITISSLESVRLTSCYKNDLLFASSIDGYLDFFSSNKIYTKSTLADFFRFNDLLDRSRKISLVDYLPELEIFRNQLISH
jgi:pyruvate-formate lyase-activating enzyme